MRYILAIDQGTTGSRAIIYNKTGKQIASAYQEFPQYFPKPGWVEHDPEEIWKSVYSSIQRVLKVVPPATIAAIGITNQRETTVVWDRKTGKPLYNAIVWQCRRTAERCDELKKNARRARSIVEKTGLPIDAYFSATKVEWILNTVKGARAKAEKGVLAFGTTDSWVLWKLTGGAVHATDYTNASRTMLFNINHMQWDAGLVRLFSVPPSLLPKVKPSSGEFGVSVKCGKLPAGVPITGIAGDQQAALFGQTCFEPGAVKNTYGTGAFMLLNAGKKKPQSKQGLITTIGCDKKGEPVYVLEGAIFIAGAAIQWLRDQLKVITQSADSCAIAQSVPDAGGVYFVPAFVGLGAPYWDQHARGMIAGITRGTTRAHIIRSALEAMCYQSKDVLDAMEKDTGLRVKKLQVDGGASANDFLCQFQSDILGVDVVRPTVIEITSLGAAYLAGLSVGFWKNAHEIKKCWAHDVTFKPSMGKACRARSYQGWCDAIKKVRSV